ncbi:hypothetical protein GC175_17525 [bacterium]|nr:hypothetical protein [bacterium]
MQLGRFLLNDDRVLAAVRFVDAVSGLPVRDAVDVSGARTRRNRSGFTVIHAPDVVTAELEHYFERFRADPHAAEPAPGSIPLTLTAQPSGGRYLPRQFTLALPLQEVDRAQPNFLFDPLEVTLYPSPSYPTESPWAILRVNVVEQATDPPVPLAGVLVTALTQPAAPNPNTVLGRGMSDRRGETLIIVPGLRPATFTDPEFTVNLDARRDNTNPTIPNPDRLINAAGDEEWFENAQLNDIVIAPGRRTVGQISMG